MKILAAIAAYLAAAGIAGFALAQDGPPPDSAPGQAGREGTEPGIPAQEAVVARILANPRMARELGLTQEQIDTLKKQAAEVKDQMVKLRAELQLAAEKQARLISERTVDEAELMTTVENTGRIRTDMSKLAVKQILLVRSTLSTEQIQRAKEMIHRRAERLPEGENGRAGAARGADRKGRGKEWKETLGKERPWKEHKAPREAKEEDKTEKKEKLSVNSEQ